MGGLGLILDVAKNALLTQQYALDVVSHNVANVSTEGYTRQSPLLEAKEAVPYGGFLFGRGVRLQEINRLGNEFIEDRLRGGKSDLAAMSEKNIYADVLESIFSENSASSLSSQFVNFWAVWNDLANNPSGLPERNLLYENSQLLCQSFYSIYSDMNRLTNEINNSIQAGVNSINQLTTQIANINQQIMVAEVDGKANDLRDRRNNLVSQLSELINIRTYESESGNLTVTTDKGFIMVSRNESYPLSFANSEVNWETSGGALVPISDTITGGKMGGWLEMRDEIIPKLMADLDELARSTILEVNKIHTQGVGLERFTSVESSYSVGTGNGGTDLGSTLLPFADAIIDGGTQSFDIWLYDANGAAVGGGATTITIDPTTDLDGLAAIIDDIDVNNGLAAGIINASVTAEGKLQIDIDTTNFNYSFAFSQDTSNALAALGINNFFTGDSALSIAVNSDLETNKNLIAAGKLDSTGNLATGDNTNALDIANLEYQGVTVKRWTFIRGSSPTSVDVNNTLLEDYLHALVGEVGIESQSIKREREYKEVMLDQISELRNNISAVSLDEEMTQLIKFQQAYTAAAKLITTVDEMFQTLLSTR